MHRSSVLPAALFFTLAGCPIWTDDGDEPPCCENTICSSDSDCFTGEVCGSDNECHEGTCETWGCPSDSICLTDVDGVSSCFDTNGGGGSGAGGNGAGGSGANGGTGGAGGAAPVYCGNPDDCAAGETCATDGTCQLGSCDVIACINGFFCDPFDNVCMHENPFACASDTDCNDDLLGSLCVSGICTPAADQCFDQTQCAGGSVCANGKCTPSCETAACDTFHSCTPGVELCTTPTLTCSITNDCGGPDVVCVDGACVARSNQDECPSGYVWVENGCISDQSAIFVCGADGSQDTCADGSVCVHHSCYISCEDPNQTACDGLPTFDICKPVTTTFGTYPVCGSDENLGDECDPTQGQLCSGGLVCIDGFCK